MQLPAVRCWRCVILGLRPDGALVYFDCCESKSVDLILPQCCQCRHRVAGRPDPEAARGVARHQVRPRAGPAAAAGRRRGGVGFKGVCQALPQSPGAQPAGWRPSLLLCSVVCLGFAGHHRCQAAEAQRLPASTLCEAPRRHMTPCTRSPLGGVQEPRLAGVRLHRCWPFDCSTCWIVLPGM